MTETTPSSLALNKIREQIAALDVAIDALVVLRDDKKIDRDFANARIDRLASRQSDLGDLRRTILLTGQVTNPPTSDQVSDLRARVVALRDMNVTAAGIEGIVREAIAIAEVVETGAERTAAPALPSRASTPSAAAPRALAFIAGAVAGFIICVALRS